MRYVFSLVGKQVKFTHAGHGTANAREIGEPFIRTRPEQLGSKNVFMHRNPLDTAISLYFQVHHVDFAPDAQNYAEMHTKLEKAGRLPPEEISAFVLHPVWGIENVCRYNRAWLDCAATRADFLTMSYEDAISDPKTAIGAASFDAMKALERSGASSGLRLSGNSDPDPRSAKVRRGVVRGYVDYLEEAEIDAARQVAAGYGFDI